jgi:septum formation protein
MIRPDLVIGSDTVVALGNTILEKPCDMADAARMLHLLSGGNHTVYSGVALLYPADPESASDAPPGECCFCEGTEVTFAQLTPELVRAYVQSGDPMDKAGAYGIQVPPTLLSKCLSVTSFMT